MKVITNKDAYVPGWKKLVALKGTEGETEEKYRPFIENESYAGIKVLFNNRKSKNMVIAKDLDIID